MGWNRVTTFLRGRAMRFPDEIRVRGATLIGIQATLIPVLVFIFVLNLLVRGDACYTWLVAACTVLLSAALALNLRLKFAVSSIISVAVILFAPWVSYFLAGTFYSGDFVPLVYMIIPIQVCSLFLSFSLTLGISAVQLAALCYMITRSPALLQINWASILSFVVMGSALNIVISYVMKRHIEMIDRQRRSLQENEKMLRDILIHDALTGVYNRRFIDGYLGAQARIAAAERRALGVIMLDMDKYKQINDTYGHIAGDHVLRQVAEALAVNVRKSDMVCRYGGDEFLVILPGCTRAEAEKRAIMLTDAVRSLAVIFEGCAIGSLGISFGAASLPEDGTTPEDAISAADAALYRMKQVCRETA